MVQWTAILVDRSREAEERHRALLTLERAGEVALLALAGLEHLRELGIQTSQGQHRYNLKLRRGMPPALSRGTARARPDDVMGTQITVRATDLPRRRAARWLASVARFAPVPVLVNGKPVADGWRGSLAQGRLASPLRGRVALLAEGDTAHASLLAHGLVSARISIPDAPGFEVAVELGPSGGELTPARLREAVAPHLPALIQQAVALIAQSAGRLPSFSEPQRARLAKLALQAVRRKLGDEAIERVAVFRCIGPDGPALLDLQTLRGLAAADPTGARTLFCLSPSQRPQSYALGEDPVLVAGDAERSLLTEVLGVRFRTPSRRESSHSLPAMAHRLARLLGRRLSSWALFLRHPLRRPPLQDHALTPGERALITALRGKLKSEPDAQVGGAAVCEGRGPLRRMGGRTPVLILPRDNPIVMASVRAFGADPGWLRLIYLALMGASGRSKRSPGEI